MGLRLELALGQKRRWRRSDWLAWSEENPQVASLLGMQRGIRAWRGEFVECVTSGCCFGVVQVATFIVDFHTFKRLRDLPNKKATTPRPNKENVNPTIFATARNLCGSSAAGMIEKIIVTSVVVKPSVPRPIATGLPPGIRITSSDVGSSGIESAQRRQTGTERNTK